MSFSDLGLKPTLLQAVSETGYTTPTPIQQRAIPAILEGGDVMAAAQTGTGKTAGFTLPLLQRLGGKPPVQAKQVRALILTPTRELAAQIQESIETYGKHEKLRSVVVFGGVNIGPQQSALRQGCDILVATPGRLLDLHQQHAVEFKDIEILVLDEADRMLDMGFIRDIRRILGLLPKRRQNLLFSATFSPEIRALAKGLCVNALEIDVAPRNSTVETITQELYLVDKEHKLGLLAKLLLDTKEQVLVFSRTKHGANNLVKKLAGHGLAAAAIHGNKSQNQRTKALADFKSGSIQVLVATDIAARGIDIDQLAMVINYDLPQVAEDYVHRIGRTGRAGASGLAVSLVSEEDEKLLRDIERLIKRRIERRSFDTAALPQRPPTPAPLVQKPAAGKEVAAKARGEARRDRNDNRRERRDDVVNAGGSQRRGERGRNPNRAQQQERGQSARPGQANHKANARNAHIRNGQHPVILHRDPRQIELEREAELQRQEGQRRQGQARKQHNEAGANGHNGQSQPVNGNAQRRRSRGRRPGRDGGGTQQRAAGSGYSQQSRREQDGERGLWNSLRSFFGNK